MVIKNGTPTVEAAGTPQLGQAVAETTPSVLSLANVVENVLANFANAARVVIDTKTGKIYATSDDTKATNLINGISGSQDMKALFKPKVGQSGKSMEWEAVAGNDWALPGVATLNSPVNPKYSASSIASRLASMIEEYEKITPAEADNSFIIIDQNNKTVGAYILPSGDVGSTRSALEGVTLNTDESVKLTLTPEPSDPNQPDKLVFEGGTM